MTCPLEQLAAELIVFVHQRPSYDTSTAAAYQEHLEKEWHMRDQLELLAGSREIALDLTKEAMKTYRLLTPQET